MGISSCKNICFDKNEREMYNQQIIMLGKNNNNNIIFNPITTTKASYNNFTKKFESKLPEFGKYYNINTFNDKIPEIAKNYMIGEVLNIPDNRNKNNKHYEMKPIQFENGNIYNGNWNENFKMDGLGKYYIEEGNIFIEGIWDDGELIYGRIFYPNENIYEGEIKNSNFNGKGKILFNNGDMYEGDFLEGDITGKGIFIYSDRTKYEGEIKNGEFKGHGIMKWTNDIQYEGEFSGAQLSNFGTLIGNGEKYEGYFNNNYFNGKGIYIYNDGSSYKGDFEFGLKNGKGIYTKKDKFIYEGDWANNMPHGIGKFIYKDYIILGIWRNGINVEISSFEKGDPSNFNNNDLNFEVESFCLMPHMLPNLETVDFNIGFGVENNLSYLNTMNE